MSDKLIDVEDIGPSFAQVLADGGLRTTDDLLKIAESYAGYQFLAERCGVTSKKVFEWVKRADLMRIKGIHSEYADLLEAAGVDTVPDLAARAAESLRDSLVATNRERRIVRRVPNVSELSEWITEAKNLPRAVPYWDPSKRSNLHSGTDVGVVEGVAGLSSN